MSAIKPGCLPWQIKGDYLPDCLTIIANVDGTTHYSYDFIAACVDEHGEASLDAVANAAFIVRACNAHDAMVEALRQYVSDLRYPPQGDSIQRRIERAEAVIRKATGGAL